MKKLLSVLVYLLTLLPHTILAQSKPIAFTGATIYPIASPPIENGTLVIQNGKILAVGASVAIPSDATRIDASGKIITAGFVDTHSHIGGGDGGDASAPIHPSVRILDAIDVRNDTFKKALAGGITTVNVMPGSGHLLSGQTVYLKLRNANTISQMLFCNDETKEICGGIKMANGTNPMRGGVFPGTRAKSAAMIRSIFIKAQDYQKKQKDAGGNPDKMPKRDLELEALVEVLEGKRIVQHHTHRADDILTVLRIAKEFGYKVVLHHVSEGWKVANEIAEAKVPCSIIVIDSPGGKLEASELRYETGGILEKAGVDVAFHTDDGITDSRLFMRSAAFGVRAGMSEQKALEGLTLAGARMLGLEKRIGSLEVGKDADFVILSGSPFSVYTKVLETWVEGEKRFDRNNPDDYKYAVGGYQVYRGEVFNHYQSVMQNEGGEQ
ncbi:MAG: amidohydrolase family protein [Chloroherpetonaceae bacterium]